MNLDDIDESVAKRFNEIRLPFVCHQNPEQFARFFEEKFILMVEHHGNETVTVSLLSPDSKVHISEMTKEE